MRNGWRSVSACLLPAHFLVLHVYSAFILPCSPDWVGGGRLCSVRFQAGRAGTERYRCLFKVTQLEGGRAGIRTQAVWL